MLEALVGCEVLLQPGDSRPRAKPAGSEARDDFFDFVVVDLRFAEDEEVVHDAGRAP